MKIELKLNFYQISALHKVTEEVYDAKTHDTTGVSYELARKLASKYRGIIEKGMTDNDKEYKIVLKPRETVLLELMLTKHLERMSESDYADPTVYLYYLNFFRTTRAFLHQKLA